MKNNHNRRNILVIAPFLVILVVISLNESLISINHTFFHDCMEKWPATLASYSVKDHAGTSWAVAVMIF